VSSAAITVCVVSVVVAAAADLVMTQSGNFWIHPRTWYVPLVGKIISSLFHVCFQSQVILVPVKYNDFLTLILEERRLPIPHSATRSTRQPNRNG
jgi:hypothetical protein